MRASLLFRTTIFSLLLCSLMISCDSTTEPDTPIRTTSRITGTVKEYASSLPLAGVRMLVIGADTIETVTNVSGKYTFDSLQVGTYDIVADMEGFFTEKRRIFLDSAMTSLEDFSLKPAATLKIHVKDFDADLPVAHALITFAETTTFTTDESGNATFKFDISGKATYAVTGTNYITDYDTINVLIGTTVVDTISIKQFANYLVALYRFSNNVVDSSGKGHDGTRHGCTFAADRFDAPSRAIRFSASADYVSVADAPALNFGRTTDFSICFWAKYDLPVPIGAIVLRKGAVVSGAIQGYSVAFGNGYNLRAQIGTNFGQTTPTFTEQYDDLWHFYVITVSREGRIYTYVDGEAYYESNQAWNPDILLGNITTSSQIYIGGKGTADERYEGYLDDIRIYAVELNTYNVISLYHENGW